MGVSISGFYKNDQDGSATGVWNECNYKAVEALMVKKKIKTT